jgi:hypothetical protein
VSVFSLIVFGFTYSGTTAGAAGTLPATVNEVVAPSGSISSSGCPAALSSLSPAPTVFGDLVSAVTAATAGQTIYVCAGAYDMSLSPYGSNEQVIINKSLTIDGYNWDVAPSPSDSPSSVDPTTQSVFENGSGFLVQSPSVTISGLTFDANNAPATDIGDCYLNICTNSISVQSLISGPGDQGESNVTVSNNLFVNTGGNNTAQNGDVHFGLGKNYSSSEPTSDVTVLDTNDVVEDNVFTYAAGFENNAVQMSDTSGALVTGNTVNYPTNDSSGVDDNAFSALWFPGFDQATTISNNNLNGGGIDSDSGSTPKTGDPKSGIKIIDSDAAGNYGDGCSNQVITNNTISGFVYDISLISTGYDADSQALCPVGPSNFQVTGNTLSNARIYGIYVSTGAVGGTISGNVVTNTDSEGYSGFSSVYSPGDYDFFDGNTTGNTWTNNSGDGTASPSSIGEVTTTTTTTVPPTTTTTTTVPPTTTTTVPPTTTTTTTVPPTTTTTVAPKASLTLSGTRLTSGNHVLITVRCATSKCGGTLKLTKTVTTKVEIGHSKKYRVHTSVEVIGKVVFSVAKGSQRPFSIPLNSAGVRLLQANNGRHFTCELAVTNAGRTKYKAITLLRP